MGDIAQGWLEPVMFRFEKLKRHVGIASLVRLKEPVPSQSPQIEEQDVEDERDPPQPSRIAGEDSRPVWRRVRFDVHQVGSGADSTRLVLESNRKIRSANRCAAKPEKMPMRTEGGMSLGQCAPQ